MSTLYSKGIHVPCVVKVNQLLQALDVAIVEELLLEVGSRSIRTACALRRYKGHVACGHCLHLTVGGWRKLRPTRIRAGGSFVTASKKFTQAKIGIRKACGVERKSEGIRGGLIKNRDSGILRQTEIGRAEASKEWSYVGGQACAHRPQIGWRPGGW